MPIVNFGAVIGLVSNLEKKHQPQGVIANSPGKFPLNPGGIQLPQEQLAVKSCHS
jgi:hypothetical protein